MPACNVPCHYAILHEMAGSRGCEVKYECQKSKKNEINRSVPLISDTMRPWETTAAFMWYQRHALKKVVRMDNNHRSQEAI